MNEHRLVPRRSREACIRESLNKYGFPLDCVESMAYLRKDDETVEIDHPLGKVWMGVQTALTSLQWSTEQVDEAAHRVKAKTKAGPWSWGSILLINVTPVSESMTRVSVAAETTITMITAIIDFGQGRRRIGQFLAELAKQLVS
jgi:hypothetical protein